MKERGMIFNGEMVRAILDGRKTQTRRVMKPQPEPCPPPRGGHWWPSNVFKTMLHVEDEMQNGKGGWGGLVGDACPFGAVGDRIWVRETWAEAGAGAPDLKLYRANYPEHVPTHYENLPPADEIRWTPSIHMPRAACRILLEVTDVRVERLNSISQEDAQAEGMELTGWRPTYTDPDSGGEVWTPYDNFAQLWESIYGEESWQANPWVWVIEFKVVPNVQDNPA
ncbi:TPA: ASCH domain-containing protein [Enterobacter roggenkampii]|uniref:ASCH domain-containing protein n=1 Tax=Enterobacter roggenkampii TaxID=1812935 RepID=UPI0032AEECAC|nr:ASCH domain-containing protein [Enterobacter roggenkampii]